MKLTKNYSIAAKIITMIVTMVVFVFGIPLVKSYLKTTDTSRTASSVAYAQSPNLQTLSGYAWSDNIGWISFSEASSPVKIYTNKSLVGYAWSDSIGWIQFGNLSGFPNTDFGTNAKLQNNELTGWARAISALPPSSGLDNRGSWDGWIALKGTTHTISKTNGVLSGYAYGADVVGWIDFSGVRINGQESDSCTGPGGITIQNGSSVLYYNGPRVPPVTGTCPSELRTCNEGVLSGSFTGLNCDSNGNTNNTDEFDCFRGGKNFKAGDTAVFYSKSIVGRGQSCSSVSKTLQCSSNGDFIDSEDEVNTTHKSISCNMAPSFIEQ